MVGRSGNSYSKVTTGVDVRSLGTAQKFMTRNTSERFIAKSNAQILNLNTKKDHL